MDVKDPQKTLPPHKNKNKPPLIPFFLKTFISYLLLFSLGLAIAISFLPFDLHQSPPSQEFAPSSQEFAPVNLTLVSTVQEPAPSSQEFAPPNLTLVSTVQEFAPSSQELAPVSQEFPPANLTIISTIHSITDDDELLRKASKVRITASNETKTKIAFLFLTRGPLPLAPLWELFFHGYEDLYSIYVHPPPTYNDNFAPDSAFFGRRIPSKEVLWGDFNMIEAERRLIASALIDDASNRHFVLLSDSCIPLFNFSTVYSYITRSSTTFVDSNYLPGRTALARYNPKMWPAISLSQWRKGSQWFHLDFPLAIIVVSDSTYLPLFRDKLFAEEHYLATLVGIKFSSRNANRGLTWVDWKSGYGAHPDMFQRPHVTPEFLGRLRGGYRCEYNGKETSVCFLFARKFMPSCLSRLMIFAPSVFHFGQHAKDVINSYKYRHRPGN